MSNREQPRTDLVIAAHTSSIPNADQFDHAAWKHAKPIRIEHYWSGEAAPPGRQAEARIVWSDTAIAILYSCRQTEPLVISSVPQTAKKTLGLWDRDVCEIFLAPDVSTPERYFEFEAAHTGEWIDLAIHTMPDKRETDWDFHSGMTSAARVEKENLTIGMHIPWDHWIHKPQKGERWRANLFRCVGSGPSRGYLAWPPTRAPEPPFHLP